MPYQVLILAVMIVVAGSDAGASSRNGSARTQILRLEQALEFLQLDVGRYPTTQEGLASLVTCPASMDCSRYNAKGYVKPDLLIDPWGEPYRYESPGTHNPEFFDVWTLGADSSPGGDGVEADLGNWMSSASRSTSNLKNIIVGAATAFGIGALVGSPVYLWGILTALRGTRTWRAALLGEPLAVVIYLAGVTVMAFLLVVRTTVE